MCEIFSDDPFYKCTWTGFNIGHFLVSGIIPNTIRVHKSSISAIGFKFIDCHQTLPVQLIEWSHFRSFLQCLRCTKGIIFIPVRLTLFPIRLPGITIISIPDFFQFPIVLLNP